MSTTTVSSPAIPSGMVFFTVPLTLLVGIGTGSGFSHEMVGTGGSINRYNLSDIARAAPDVQAQNISNSAADDIDYIKSQLKLTVTELAKYLGVSRQAIYGWRTGAHIKSNNISKLENLRDAASVLDASDISPSALHLSRKLPGGRTLLETIADGGNGYNAATSLVNMLRRETEQRTGRFNKVMARRPIVESDFNPGMATIYETR